MHGPNGRQQLVFLAFDNKTRCTQSPAAADVAIIHRVHDYRYGQSGLPDEFEKQEPVSAGHTDIHESDINMMPAQLLKSVSSVRRFCNNGNLRGLECQA